MHTDVWSVVAQHERELNSVEKLQKLKLITRRTDLELLVAYYKISNKLLKKLLKTKVRIQALLWSVSK